MFLISTATTACICLKTAGFRAHPHRAFRLEINADEQKQRALETTISDGLKQRPDCHHLQQQPADRQQND